MTTWYCIEKDCNFPPKLKLIPIEVERETDKFLYLKEPRYGRKMISKEGHTFSTPWFPTILQAWESSQSKSIKAIESLEKKLIEEKTILKIIENEIYEVVSPITKDK
jgi:hypothetical protein